MGVVGLPPPHSGAGGGWGGLGVVGAVGLQRAQALMIASPSDDSPCVCMCWGECFGRPRA